MEKLTGTGPEYIGGWFIGLIDTRACLMLLVMIRMNKMEDEWRKTLSPMILRTKKRMVVMKLRPMKLKMEYTRRELFYSKAFIKGSICYADNCYTCFLYTTRKTVLLDVNPPKNCVS